jgi:hypothetical protein
MIGQLKNMTNGNGISGVMSAYIGTFFSSDSTFPEAGALGIAHAVRFLSFRW